MPSESENPTAPRGKQIHVAICIPSGEMVHADFMLAVLHLVQRGRADGFRLSIVNSKASLITQGRNNAVAAALDAGADWLLFLDSDMIFPPDTLGRLLAHQRPMVGATYPRKQLPLAFIGVAENGERLMPAMRGLVSAGRLPAGCLLIEASVFTRLKRPYFRCRYDEAAGQVLSEDFWFCEEVRRHGVAIWCDMTLSREVAHLGTQRFQFPP